MIAKVLVDSPLPHLDRDFDYLVPDALGYVQVGTRVRVPFAGRLVSGVVHSLSESSTTQGLKALKSAAAVPTYSAASFELAELLGARYGGSLWDALRLMAPPRVASVDKLDWNTLAATGQPEPADTTSWPAGTYSLPTRHMNSDAAPTRLLWLAQPHEGQLMPAEQLLQWLTPRSEHGSTIAVVPDLRHIKAVLEAASALGLTRWTPRSGGDIAVLTTEDGPRLRYASYLAALRGVARIVIGTRQAAWQAVPHLEAIAVWEESLPAYAEPRSPYPHSRTVAAMRSHDGADLLLAGRVLSPEALALASSGFASLVPDKADLEHRPRVTIVDEQMRAAEGGQGKHWLPSAVLGRLRGALSHGPCGVVVPQRGFGAVWACARCGVVAQCPRCHDDLYRLRPDEILLCRSCRQPYPAWHCAECTHSRATPVGLGVDRVSQELARTLSDVTVATSSSSHGLIPDGSSASGLIVATPGALPSVPGGYQMVVVLGAMDGLDIGLGAEVQGLRRLMHHASLAKGAKAGGDFVVTQAPVDTIAQALVTWDPLSLAFADLEERRAAQLPPHRRSAHVRGTASDIADVVLGLQGPLDTFSDDDGVWILASLKAMPGIVRELRERLAARSAAGKAPVTVHVDAPIGGSRHAFSAPR